MSEGELDRQTIEHYTFKLAFKQNFAAPIRDILEAGPARCIDIGTGMGIWVMEMSADFPNSEFIGVDKLPTFPAEVYPRNADFQIMDATKPWPYEDNSIDFVHQRQVGLFFYKRDDWKFVLKEMMRVIKPGGWIQLVENGIVVERGTELGQKICYWVIDVMEAQQHEPLIAERFGEILEEYGFENIENSVFSIPFGKWGGTVGTLLKEDAKGWADNLKSTIIGLKGITESEYDAASDGMMKDADTLQTYVDCIVCCGQKPLK